MIKMIKGGVTAAKGFCAASTAAGIKYQNRQDMAMLYSEVPCAVAGTFTTNLVKAAPVKWDQKIVYESKKAVVINAGIANACTGEEGMRYCRQTAEKVGELLPVPKDQVLVASTGVIGMQLPMERICAGIETMVPALSGETESGHAAAQAIMTTDTHEKEIAGGFSCYDRRHVQRLGNDSSEHVHDVEFCDNGCGDRTAPAFRSAAGRCLRHL